MNHKVAEVLLILFVLAMIAYPIFWVVATVQACGWKGIFVECRIAEVK